MRFKEHKKIILKIAKFLLTKDFVWCNMNLRTEQQYKKANSRSYPKKWKEMIKMRTIKIERCLAHPEADFKTAVIETRQEIEYGQTMIYNKEWYICTEVIQVDAMDFSSALDADIEELELREIHW